MASTALKLGCSAIWGSGLHEGAASISIGNWPTSSMEWARNGSIHSPISCSTGTSILGQIWVWFYMAVLEWYLDFLSLLSMPSKTKVEPGLPLGWQTHTSRQPTNTWTWNHQWQKATNATRLERNREVEPSWPHILVSNMEEKHKTKLTSSHAKKWKIISGKHWIEFRTQEQKYLATSASDNHYIFVWSILVPCTLHITWTNFPKRTRWHKHKVGKVMGMGERG